MALFDQIFEIIVGEEGGFDNTPSDPGNWTGGSVGAGMLNGTNWGISAAAFPNEDIRNLTQAQAKAIYFGTYWTPCSCDKLPTSLALMTFDAAVNNGCVRAREWLQAALGVATDGNIGPETLAALATALAQPGGDGALAAEFLARRVDFMGGLKTWQTFGLGWSRRLAALPWKAMTLAQSNPT
jgi:lysozyme family protein